MKRILIATDAWTPQVNGVVRTMHHVISEIQKNGHHVCVVSPTDFKTLPAPGYAEISLSLFPKRKMRRVIDDFQPTHIHIVTEGPIGWAMRAICQERGLAFTTAYHTQFPEYLKAHFRIPETLGYRIMRRFHAPSSAVMTATPSLKRHLESQNFRNLQLWTRGVDLDQFSPIGDKAINLPGPTLLYVGRVSVEKNLPAFLEMPWDGDKLVVGDGPALSEFKRRYPKVHFVGAQHGEQLAAYYRSGDIFVFPSQTDTYGLVLLEALASGLPVAAYPVTGPIDVLAHCPAAILDHSLETAVHTLFKKMPEIDFAPLAYAFAQTHSWAHCAQMFDDMLVHCAGPEAAPSPSTPSPSTLGCGQTPLVKATENQHI